MKRALCILGLAASAPVLSDELEYLQDLTLEELLNVKVSVASVKPELVIETPAIVSRYDRLDLESMGITTLREMFNFIPGVIVQDHLGGWSSVQIRGIDEVFNQKVLFLLDGVPYHQPSHSMIPMEGVPWESISHVEVIRGPGTVLHGSQASGGVFNVVTKKPEVDEASVALKMGLHRLRQGSAYFNKALSNGSGIYVAAEYRDEDGYTVTYDELFEHVGLVSDEVKRYLAKQSALMRYHNEDFVLQMHAFSDTTVGINDGYTDVNTLQPLTLDTQGQLIHVENSWHFDDRSVSVFADYNRYTFDLRLGNLFAPGVDAIAKKENNGEGDYRFRYGANLTQKISPSLEVVAGIEKESRSIDNYGIYLFSDQENPLVTLLESGKTGELSTYMQMDYHVGKWRLLFGARHIENERSGHKTTPRAAVVYQINTHHSLKALYSTGFNSPNPTQTSIKLPGDVMGNEQLTAEVVKTTDLAYSYSKDNILLVANIYSFAAEDFIQRRYSDKFNANSFFNEGNYRRTGAELDFQMANKQSKLFVNLTYQREGNTRLINDPAAFKTPRLTFAAGASTYLWSKHSIGADITYIGKRQKLDDYSIVNLNYTAKLSGYDIVMSVRNIFDQAILNPDISSQNSTLVAQGEDGINAQFGVRFYF